MIFIIQPLLQCTGEHANREVILPMKVLLDGSWSEERLGRLRELVREDIELTVDASSGDYRVLVSGRPDAGLITGSHLLEHLLIPWAGLPASTRDLMKEHGNISVHNIHHNAASAAELAVGLMIAAARLIVPADRDLRKGDWTWRYRQERCILLCGSNVLVLGYGSLGRRVGKACEALGASVRGIRRSVDGPVLEGTVEVFPPSRLHHLLERTDFLVLSLPLTETTEGVIGSAELALMHERSVLVNVGRGSLVDQEALYRSLSEGLIGAAGLDVWYRYPEDEAARTCTKPSDHDFASLDNVVMTPHMGGAFGSDSLESARMEWLAASLNELAGTGMMPYMVDLDRGY